MANSDDGRHLFGMNNEEQQWKTITSAEQESQIRNSSSYCIQEADDDTCCPQSCSPLGLTLRKTSSFMCLLEQLSGGGNQGEVWSTDGSSRHQANCCDKLKASNFPIHFLRIGSWEKITSKAGDLVAKLYFSKRRLVWEILDGSLKNKLEMEWNDITAIRARTPHNQLGTLEIELSKPPLYYRETDPHPRKHTIWHQASDFTGGEAQLWRRHFVAFPPGILEKNYQKLLQIDGRIEALSKQPFPTQNSPYFPSAVFECQGFHPGLQQYPCQNYTGLAPGAAHFGQMQNPAISDVGYADGGQSNLQFVAEPVLPPQHLHYEVLDPLNYPHFVGSINSGESTLTEDSPGMSSEENMAYLQTNYQQGDATAPVAYGNGIQWRGYQDVNNIIYQMQQEQMIMQNLCAHI